MARRWWLVNIAQAILQIKETLNQGDVPDARRDAELLVSFVAGKNKTFIVAHPEHELSADETSRLDNLTSRRLAREPLQYILGRQEFYGLEFDVTPDVLIPRPETEILVERAVEFLKPRGNHRFCEIGIGSGCISISVLYQLKNVTAIAGDVSKAALTVSERNAQKHGVRDRIQLIESDVYSNIPNMYFDAILSNPPYVPERDLTTLQPEVRDHEPQVALTSGAQGLDVIHKLVSGASSRLNDGGALIFEMGFNQSPLVSELFDRHLWQSIEILPDLQGIPRIAFAVKR
jgi:release factor glutamine methyltransferase